ncbi:MAG: alpha/beta fold hydrolase [Candidatus Limnocylindrales bacterium]
MTAGIRITGLVGAPAIVFVHGTRLTGSMWAAQVTALADTYRCITVDLPGHGALADRTFTLDAASDVVAQATQSATDGRAVVVGLSLGGYTAMHLAARRPDLVRGLVLSGATAEPVGWRSVPYRALAAAMEAFDGPRLDALNAWFFRTRFPPAIAEPIIAGGFWSAGGADALRALVGERFAPRLAAYPGPTLLLNGSLDVAFRLSVGTFARAAQDPRRVRLGGATHLANIDRPKAFTAAIRTFMASLDGDAGGSSSGAMLDSGPPSDPFSP